MDLACFHDFFFLFYMYVIYVLCKKFLTRGNVFPEKQ